LSTTIHDTECAKQCFKTLLLLIVLLFPEEEGYCTPINRR